MEASPLPGFRFMAEHGFSKPVSAVFPTVTNANNASICCGTWPKEHGITGNSYFNEHTGEADYMENADFICVPTIIQRAAERGVKSALLTCKVKTIHLLGRGAEIAVAAEAPPAEWIERYGKPANIYSREINYWLWQVAVDILKHRPDIGLLVRAHDGLSDAYLGAGRGRIERASAPSISCCRKPGLPRRTRLFCSPPTTA